MDAISVSLRKRSLNVSFSKCIICDSIDISNGEIKASKVVAITNENGQRVRKEVITESKECMCKKCFQKYLIDYGTSTYTVYEPPISKDNSGNTCCLAKYESEFNYDFTIHSTLNPNRRPKRIYYMIYESEPDLPIILRYNEVKAFLKDYSVAIKFAHDFYMSIWK